jgi:glycosyltransferase 2 family protein
MTRNEDPPISTGSPRYKTWLIRLVRVLFICAVFVWMLRPVYRKWDQVRGPILATNWWAFAGAAAMFSIFLFAFRAMAWRHILKGLGHRLPVAPATRIWSFSELARYLPGVIWQVVGRVYLSKPYGVSGAISSASQLLELSIFMLANIIVALACLLAAGLRLIPADQRKWIFIAMAFVPALLILLHPRVFYSLLNRLLVRLKKQPIVQRLPKRQLALVLAWTIIGLLWQSLAVWLLTRSTLHLPIGKWYVLAGSYCLAWTIGFSVGFLSPGGMGVREMVFITTMQFLLPQQWVARNLSLTDHTVFLAFLGFLGVLLRLWAITGELTMAAITYFADYRGAMNHADSPGKPTAAIAAPPAGSLAVDANLDRSS